jgi:5-formyltetrahydrofolate cyclo-ligase
VDNKAALRKALAARRRDAFEKDGHAGERLRDVFLRDGPEVPTGAVVSGFWPFGTEIDVRPLMEHLRGAGAILALPHAPDRLGHLDFRRYDGGSPAAKDAWGMPAPAADAERLRPAIVLTPLLGFDRVGGRIGYGAGLYDRALKRLRDEGPVLAVGLCFASQEVGEIPREPHDELLDWVITEEGVKLRPDDL